MTRQDVQQCQMCHGTGDDLTVDAPHPHPQPACPLCEGSGEVMVTVTPHRKHTATESRMEDA